jgi:putative membrane protein
VDTEGWRESARRAKKETPMKRMMICIAAAALMSACTSGPTGEAALIAETAMDQPAPTAPEFVRMAGASDLYEIQSSQLVLQDARNPELRRFAEMMVDHHTMTTRTVMDAAQAAGMTPPPPALDSAKAEMIRQLRTAQGEAREALYMQQQVTAHQEALMLHARYSRNGDTPELKRASAAAVPIVSRHYNEIVSMQRGAGGESHGHRQ